MNIMKFAAGTKNGVVCQSFIIRKRLNESINQNERKELNKMRLNDVCEVKKWFRGIPCVKSEIELKIEFYKELCRDFKDTPGFEKSVEYYKGEINALKDKLDCMLADMNRLFGMLDETERLVLTARYINLIKWDFIELKIYFSRRQAIRVHDAALRKLVGQEVGAVYDLEYKKVDKPKRLEKKSA